MPFDDTPRRTTCGPESGEDDASSDHTLAADEPPHAAGALGHGARRLALAGLFADQNATHAGETTPAVEGGGGVKQPHFVGRVKRVIHFFLNGGPSHVDTFDPKPALDKYAGQPAPVSLTTERKTGAAFPSPFKFAKYGQSGLEISELFAKTGRMRTTSPSSVRCMPRCRITSRR